MGKRFPGPHVGVFWVYRGEIFGEAVEFDRGVTTSLGIVDADVDHAGLWERHGAYRTRFPELADAEYFDVPRGRVVFDIGSNLAIVYLDARLNTRLGRALIRRFFGLTVARTRWSLDSHYMTH